MYNSEQNIQSSLSAMTSKMDSQVGFFVKVSQSIMDGAQQLSTLNLQVAKTVLDEAANNTHQLFSSQRYSGDGFTASNEARPAIEKILAYQQHVQRIFSDTQSDIAKSYEAYMPEANQKSQDILQTMTKIASDQTSDIVQRQQDASEKFSADVKQNADQASKNLASSTEQQKDAMEKIASATKQSLSRSAEGSIKEVTAK